MTSDEENLLASLEAHGAQFLKSFGDLGSKRKGVDNDLMRDVNARTEEDEAETEDEWRGIASEYQYELDMSQEAVLEDASESRSPEVVVFAENTTKRPATATKLQSRAFMSSRVSKLKDSPTELSGKSLEGNEEADQDMSNLQNDALLHRLVHTKLLSGSFNPDLNMTPAQRRKAFAGRVLELNGDSRLGKGEADVRQDEKNRASRRVRDGMIAKQKERNKKALDEAKNAGNYHPALKKLFATSSSDGQTRKRDRGLNMGVGRFSGGILKLRSQDISSVRDIRSSRSRGKGKKR